MEDLQRLYPIGIQTFSKIREGNYLYIDKTEYVYRMTHSASSYMFLSRPRRFGKSLLTSTLHSYFSGRKELFHGLAMEKLEKEWTEYPVLHFDMSMAKHVDKGGLERLLDFMLAEYERTFAINAVEGDANLRLVNLIKRAYEQTGKKVVVLIDEYDAPLLDVVHEDTSLGVLREVMRNFYSPLKDSDRMLRFVFLTGITKFSQLSIFSELNNITNVSMDTEYAGICGITKEELVTEMHEDIQQMADVLGLSYDKTLEKLKENYDGYHFAWPSSDIFNPYSLLTCFSKRKVDSYWFGSGTPTYLLNMMRKYDFTPIDLGEQMDASKDDFDAATETMTTIMPLLYQSGYITIKNYDPETELYTLALPNKEVRIGLYRSMLPHYLAAKSAMCNTTVAKMSALINKGNMDGALQLLKTFWETVPYCDNTDYEGHYQQTMYIIFALLTNFRILVEQHTFRGRTDITMETKDTIYVIELKFNKSAQEALDQINNKHYADAFALKGKTVEKIGMNFMIDEDKTIVLDWAK